jgi:hypothetical protein
MIKKSVADVTKHSTDQQNGALRKTYSWVQVYLKAQNKKGL